MYSTTCRIYKGSLLTQVKMKKEEKKAEPKEAREKWQWLIEPQSVFTHPPGELFQDSIIFIVLALATYLVADYLHAINFAFFFIRWGSLALLVLTLATILYALKMLAHLIHGIARLRKPYKFTIFIAVIIGALLVIFYRDAIVPPFLRWLWRLPLGNLNPFSFYWWNPAYW
jgi:cation transport ATPase